jgi:hypothetical protein
VLASSNSDEALRGFYTKYDASSADINPIGSLNKGFLKEFLQWCADTVQIHDKAFEQIGYQFNMLEDIINVTASPELTPADEDGNIQDDEVAIGMTYDDLRLLGELRKIHKLGPLGMFHKLLELKVNEFPSQTSCISVQLDVRKFREFISPMSVYNKVLMFFKQYAQNRHKMNILTNAIHLTSYSPDDNRYDHRPFMLDINWKEQMDAIQALAASMEQNWKTTHAAAYKAFQEEYPAAYAANSVKSPETHLLKAAATELKNKEAAESAETWKQIWENRQARLGRDEEGIIKISHALADLDILMNKNKVLKAKQTKTPSEDLAAQIAANDETMGTLKQQLIGAKTIIETKLHYKIPFLLDGSASVATASSARHRRTYRRNRHASRSYTRSR